MDYNKMPTNSFEHFYLSWMPEKGKIKRPCYLTLANALEADIVSGKLASGTKLPPQRELADYLDLNFTTVTQAYNLCRERRLIYGVTGKGTFVSPLPGKNIIHHSGSQEGIIELGLLKGFDQIKAPIIEASKKVLQKGYIEELYSYTEVAGHLHQRVAGAHWMKQMDVHTDSEHTAIFSGAQNIISATLLSLFQGPMCQQGGVAEIQLAICQNTDSCILGNNGSIKRKLCQNNRIFAGVSGSAIGIRNFGYREADVPGCAGAELELIARLAGGHTKSGLADSG